MSAVGPESLIAARFRLLEPIGEGGMATVYRAIDVETQRTVAVKLLEADYDRARFDSEAEVLAELVHPRIVRYIAHGMASENRAFLAMEWLEGEDLAARLARGGLPLREAIQITRDLADGLAVAHARGIVHRDLKPSNVFLRDRRSDGVTLLDFGVARRVRDGRGPRTRTGALVGTPHYMAPEQASGEKPVGPAADVFALGCMLYECLTGTSPFLADSLVAVLAKILFAEPDALAQLRPELPEPVVALVNAMLAKDPDQRPHDAAAVIAAIDALGPLPPLGPPGELATPAPRERLRASRPVMSTPSEQQLVCVIVASGDVALPATLRELLGLEQLSDGSYVATLLPDGKRVALDQAMHAARVALRILDHAPEARIVVTTGRGMMSERLPIGEAIDRAVKLLPPSAGIVVDELTSALIERRFEVTAGARLVGEHSGTDSLRMLLGKPTPCVGREQELGTLETTLATCVDDSVASAVLITGASGMGKTRIRHELVRRVRARYESVEVIVGVADVSRVGATYNIIGSALADLRAQHDLLEHVPAADRARLGELLAELCGTPVDTPSEALVRLRAEPRRLGEEMASAFIELLWAETGKRPVLLVLDDVHWADPASLRLVQRALRDLHERPLFIVALSRPLQDDALWAGDALRVPLRPLSRRACEKLAIEVLGSDVPPDVIGRIVEQSAGNALFLEELIRAVREGRRELPDSVLAMLQSRIAGLPPELRRVLRTAAVFGQRFRREGIAAVLDGAPADNALLGDWLTELIRLEIIEPSGDGFAFRHALVAEAAYELLTPDDREAAHLAAGAYLEAEGQHASSEIAEHFYRANALTLAVPWYMRAGYEANAVGDLAAARLHYAAASDALRGLPDDTMHRRMRIDILLQQAQMGIIADVPDLNLARVVQAREILESIEDETADDDRRREGMIDFLWARVLSYVGSLSEAHALCERVVGTAGQLGDDPLSDAASQTIGTLLLMQGQVTRAEPLLARAAGRATRAGSDYDRLRYMSDHAHCLALAGRYRDAMALHGEAVAIASAAKHSSGLAVALAMRAFSERAAGDPAAHDTIEMAIDHADRSQERLLHYLLVATHAWVEGLAGRRDVARAHREDSRQLADALGARICYDDLFTAADAQVALVLGDVDEAIEIASAAVPRFRADELMLGLGLCEQVWGLALVERGDPAGEVHLELARDVFARTGQRLASARLAFEWARRARVRGDAPRAAALRAEAAETYSAGGAASLIDLIDPS